jgi:hypothetical protein
VPAGLYLDDAPNLLKVPAPHWTKSSWINLSSASHRASPYLEEQKQWALQQPGH